MNSCNLCLGWDNYGFLDLDHEWFRLWMHKQHRRCILETSRVCDPKVLKTNKHCFWTAIRFKWTSRDLYWRVANFGLPWFAWGVPVQFSRVKQTLFLNNYSIEVNSTWSVPSEKQPKMHLEHGHLVQQWSDLRNSALFGFLLVHVIILLTVCWMEVTLLFLQVSPAPHNP